MPIRPENLARYPHDWPAISWTIRWIRALGRCECRGECSGDTTGRPAHTAPLGRCPAVNGQPNPLTGSLVVLTVAHLDHQPEHCEPTNLRAFCQLCHLRYDRDHHAETRRQIRERQLAAAGVTPLSGGWGGEAWTQADSDRLLQDAIAATGQNLHMPLETGTHG